MFEASEGKRLLNFIIDQLVLWLLFKFNFIHVREYFHNVPARGLVLLFCYCLLRFAYFFFSEYYLGKTLGKFVTNTFVVDIYGNKPTAKALAIRTLCRIIPFDNLSFLAATNGWHDSLSDTRVVNSVSHEEPVIAVPDEDTI